jgi:hypothetical protein
MIIPSRMCGALPLLLRAATVAVFILTATFMVAAQQPEPVDAAIESATATHIKNESKVVKGWALIVRFTQNFDPDNAIDRAKATAASSYKIINVNTGTWVPVSEAKFIVVQGKTVDQIRLVVPSADALNTTDFFHL